jgi:hypothetical protein
MSFEEHELQPPPSRFSGLLSKVLVGIAVVALLGAVGLGGAFLLGNKAAPGSSPAASPTPRPTPTAALERFRAAAANPKRAYHVKFVMTVEVAGSKVESRAELDVSGSDWKGTVTVTSGGKTTRTQTIRKSGKTYNRSPGGNWRVGPASGAVMQASDPFGSASVREALDDFGVAKRAGKSLHWLHAAALVNAADALKRFGLTGTVQASSIDVYVTDAGVPVQAVQSLTSALVPSGIATVTMTHDISAWGKAVKIVAPKT